MPLTNESTEGKCKEARRRRNNALVRSRWSRHSSRAAAGRGGGGGFGGGGGGGGGDGGGGGGEEGVKEEQSQKRHKWSAVPVALYFLFIVIFVVSWAAAPKGPMIVFNCYVFFVLKFFRFCRIYVSYASGGLAEVCECLTFSSG